MDQRKSRLDKDRDRFSKDAATTDELILEEVPKMLANPAAEQVIRLSWATT